MVTEEEEEEGGMIKRKGGVPECRVDWCVIWVVVRRLEEGSARG
eukprot:CAMPEP_0184352642 /NCGR_PEP_ID=MMETSP1089-20130417/68398_1 /TAXON_ID=38269 ORGANISM="Gloeochaete wittrockiana, Strain SAG46.84" /NCGR_SAMPLE_ID=MMETSP1089 /ASSEMBLY_ACC=CAM_ASM_000445 /LENGTH=43 /DNA_ID= /DNA_START= /DNA_END= /DNA_ORIENTATION=